MSFTREDKRDLIQRAVGDAVTLRPSDAEAVFDAIWNRAIETAALEVARQTAKPRRIQAATRGGAIAPCAMAAAVRLLQIRPDQND